MSRKRVQRPRRTDTFAPSRSSGCSPIAKSDPRSSSRYLKQLDVPANLGGVEDRLAVCGPGGEVAAALVKVRHLEEQNPTLIPAEIRQLPQPCAITTHDVRIPAAVLPADKQQPLAVGRPAWSATYLPTANKPTSPTSCKDTRPVTAPTSKPAGSERTVPTATSSGATSNRTQPIRVLPNSPKPSLALPGASAHQRPLAIC